MRHFAAHYIFDGETLIKNSFITVGESGIIKYISKRDEGLIERPRMIFFNGIICPSFITINNVLEEKRNVLSDIKSFSKKNEQFTLVEILKIFTKDYAILLGKLELGRLEIGLNPGIILLENIDIQNLKIKNNTTVTILI